MTWYCQGRRAFISPRTGLIVLSGEACAAGGKAACWFAGDDLREVHIWEGWSR